MKEGGGSGSLHTEVLKDLIAGLVSGMTSRYVEYPFDTIKVRLQTDIGIDAHSRRYSSTWNCVTQTIKEEGIRGIYRGVGATLGGAAAESAVMFLVYNRAMLFLRHTFPPSKKKDSQAQFRWYVSLSGLISGSFAAVVLTPFELVKCRLQVQDIANTKYRGVLDCAIKVVKTEGFFHGLFRGFTPTLIRDGPGTAIWFLSYEMACQSMTPKDGNRTDLEMYQVMAAGALAGVAYWTALFPIVF